jgi:putative ubiquitin-RnfH superfamily antitoxin RatB of RatAB toxin-antitoxin module
LKLPDAATVRTAIEASGVLEACADIDLDRNRVGIFGKAAALEQVLHQGDRVEIYRGLSVDPKDARRGRARRRHSAAG